MYISIQPSLDPSLIECSMYTHTNDLSRRRRAPTSRIEGMMRMKLMWTSVKKVLESALGKLTA